MNLIDTHGHLNFQAFTENWAAVADRARERGLQAVVMPSSQLATSRRAVELAAARPDFLFAAVGLHPIHVAPVDHISDPKESTDTFEEFYPDQYLALARLPEVVVIGEVGLDTFRTSATLFEQEKVLQAFISIAREVNKPLILHCRAARTPVDQVVGSNPHDRLIEILSSVTNRPPFVIHCYQGNPAQAEAYLALGGLISFTGTITYSYDPAVVDVVRQVPLNRLMIETDSPYLSPVPYRGEPNEPWKVVEVARRIAELKNCSINEVARVTTATAQSFFRLPEAVR